VLSFIFIEKHTIGILIVLLFSILSFLSLYFLFEKTDDYREKEIARKIDNLPKNSSVLVITGNRHKNGIINKIETNNVDVLDNK
jgi:preprotein translocase subunit YajC